MEGFFPLLEKESLGEKLGSGLPFSHVYGRFQQLLPAHEVGWSQHLMSPPTNVHLRTVLLVVAHQAPGSWSVEHERWRLMDKKEGRHLCST